LHCVSQSSLWLRLIQSAIKIETDDSEFWWAGFVNQGNLMPIKAGQIFIATTMVIGHNLSCYPIKGTLFGPDEPFTISVDDKSITLTLSSIWKELPLMDFHLANHD
jgi:hypothetical protein